MGLQTNEWELNKVGRIFLERNAEGVFFGICMRAWLQHTRAPILEGSTQKLQVIAGTVH